MSDLVFPGERHQAFVAREARGVGVYLKHSNQRLCIRCASMQQTKGGRVRPGGMFVGLCCLTERERVA